MLCCLLISALSAGTAYSQTSPDSNKQQTATPSGLQIGIVAPFDGNYALIAKQIRLGAEAANQQSAQPVTFTYFQESCKSTQDAATAEKIRQANIRLVIGYVCSESLEGAAPVLARDNIAILSLGSRQRTLAEQQTKQNFGIFRLQADRTAAISVLAEQLSPIWRTVPFALIEDGTVQGRDFARQVLSEFKARGLEPAFTDTYRPAQPAQTSLIARLKRAGIHHVLLGGEGDDASIIARSAAAANHPLTIAGSDTLLRADPLNPLPAGLLMSAIPEPELQSNAAEAVKAIDIYARQNTETAELQTETYALLAYAAMQIAGEALTLPTDKPLAEFLRKNHFETATGAVSFTPQGLRRENPYRLLRFNGKVFELSE